MGDLSRMGRTGAPGVRRVVLAAASRMRPGTTTRRVAARRRIAAGGPRRLAAAVVVLAGATLLAAGSSGNAGSAGRVLLVGTFHGVHGRYTSIQAAVNAAGPGDWILVGPGDYHERNDLAHPPSAQQASLGNFGGVLVHVPGLHIRGMDRNTVLVDGTKPGAPVPCDPQAQYQQLGATTSHGKHQGRNGIVAFRADNVSVQNLTVCNFLSGAGSSGNEIWWNGGAGTGRVGLSRYQGSYLTATSSYYGNPSVAAAYGIFVGNSAGPASWNQIYASNFDDSGMYVGACRQLCDVTISHAQMEYNALGYSGTNAGGAIVIKRSTFDNNQDGFDTNTQIRSDPPPPQQGNCPANKKSPITHTRSCWVFEHNLVTDNNNANALIAPGGAAAAGPVGTGMTISGGRNDTVMDNTVVGNNAWGILFVPYPDSNKPFKGVTCAGSGGAEMSGLGCVYESSGDALLNNTFQHNGSWANPTNGDFGELTLRAGAPSNCFAGNVAPDGSAPPNLEQIEPTCGPLTTATQSGVSGGSSLLTQVGCDTRILPCPAGALYPKPYPGDVVIHPLPRNLPSMPNPCGGVPANAWCRGDRPI